MLLTTLALCNAGEVTSLARAVRPLEPSYRFPLERTTVVGLTIQVLFNAGGDDLVGQSTPPADYLSYPF